MKKDMSEFTIATANRLGINEDVVHELVMWQFEELKKQSHKHTSIELAGIGRLYVRYGMLRAKLKRYEEMLEAYLKQEMTTSLEKKIENLRAEIDILKIKTESNEFQEYMGRVAQQFNTTKGIEGGNTEDTE